MMLILSRRVGFPVLRPTTRDRTICERAARVLSLTLLLWAAATALARETAKPVWVVSNGFHTSLAVRVRDLPFAREIVGDRRADAVLIGWGAEDYYRGKVKPWTFCKALCGASPSLLHVVPVRGPVADRFQHSDVVQLNLTPPQPTTYPSGRATGNREAGAASPAHTQPSPSAQREAGSQVASKKAS
jgi:hypothetical protein